MRTAHPRPLFTLLLAVALMAGCNGVAPGNDPLVVNAERAIETSFEAVSAFVLAEDDNQEAIKRDFPVIHLYAETIRKEAPKAFAEATTAVRAYKRSRTTADGDLMNAKLARVQSLARTAREYLLRIQSR